MNKDARTEEVIEDNYKFDFINTFDIRELAEYVLDEHLDDFCEHYAKEFEEFKQRKRMKVLEEV